MVKTFNYFQPTDIRFGCGRIKEVGDIVAQFGKRCILVTVPVFNAIEPVIEKVKKSLSDSFEAYIHKNTSPYIEILALEAIRLVAEHLYTAVRDGSNSEVRSGMSWADTLAGLSIANAGVTLPHGIAMAIGGNCPHVMHGEALAAVYPQCMRFTYSNAVQKFAMVARIFHSDLTRSTDETAAKRSCSIIDDFLKRIGMYFSLEDLKVHENEIEEIADHSMELPDYTNNPRVATRDEVFEILKKAFRH